MRSKVVIVDYGVGNVHSVGNAIKALGYDCKISRSLDVLSSADALILPGVGAFGEAMHNLSRLELTPVLNELVLVQKKPIIGICLGMQILATDSEENGYHKGLDWIPGSIKKLELPKGFRVPHVGWNDLSFNATHPLFMLNEEGSHFYFDHGYHFVCDEKYIAATCEYGKTVTAAVYKDNIFGAQFHPEKSQTAGLKLFRSFFNYLKLSY